MYFQQATNEVDSIEVQKRDFLNQNQEDNGVTLTKAALKAVVIILVKTLINLIMSKHVPLAGGRYSRIMGLLSLGGLINNNVILLNFNNFCFH